MTDEIALPAEIARVRAMLADSISEMGEGEDMRIFAAALLTAAIELHVEVEGMEGLQRAVAALASRHLVASGQAGRA